MLSRRSFLLYLASLSASLGVLRKSPVPSKQLFTPTHELDLVLYQGWILRADDPVGSKSGRY